MDTLDDMALPRKYADGNSHASVQVLIPVETQLKQTRGRRAFTLMELLVSIAVIGVLAGLLLTSIAHVKKKAWDASCKSNLHQWGIAWMNYTSDNDGHFSSGMSVRWARGEWLAALRNTYNRAPDLLLCPRATHRRGPGDQEVQVSNFDPSAVDYGGPTTAWAAPLPDTNHSPPILVGSYGMNVWVYNPPQSVTNIQGRPTGLNLRNMDVPNPSMTPLFGDSMWRGGGPTQWDLPPSFNGQWLGAEAEMNHFAIARHGNGINLLFLDSSVRHERARDLWNLPWNPQFDVTYASSHVQFPNWMN